MEQNQDPIDDKTIEQIKQGLDFMDQSISVETPNLGQFRQLVAQVEEMKQVRSKWESFIFMLTAITLLGIEIFSFSRSITAFIIIQAVAIILLPAIIFGFKRKEHRQVKST